MALTVAQLVARLTADTSGFYRGMALANSSMIRSGGIISRVAAGAGLAVAGIGIVSLRAAGNFEESMNVLGAVSHANKGQFSALREEAVALGRDMKLPNVSAKDAATAMLELARGGLSVKEILDNTRGTLQLGLAANVGFAESAVVVARALKAFHLEGAQASKIADLFAAAANATTADVTDIALGFQMASAQFYATGQTIHDLTTAIAIMADNAIVGSDAGTSLKTMINRLTAPTKKAKELMGDLGIKVYDAQGNFKSMPQIIGTFAESLKGMSEEQKNANLYTIFGSDAIRAARVLIGGGTKGWKEYAKEVGRVGEAQRITEARVKGFTGAIGALGSAAETLAIDLGTAMLPAATKSARAMANFINNLDPRKIIGFFSAIKDGVTEIYRLISGSDAAVAVLGGLVAGFAAFRILTGITGIVRGFAAAMWAANAAMLANPIILAAAALVALAAGLYIAYQRSEQFRAIVDKTFSWVRENLGPIASAAVQSVTANWAKLKADTLSTYNALKGYVQAGISFIKGLWERNGAEIVQIVRAYWTIVRTLVQTQIQNLRSIISIALAVIRGDWGRAWDELKGLVSRSLSAAVTVVKQILTNLIPAVLTLAVRAGIAIQMGIIRGLANLFVAIWGKIFEALSTAISTAASWAAGAAPAIGRAIAEGVLSGIAGLPGALAGKLVGAVTAAKDKAMAAIGAKSPSTVFANQVGKPIADGIILGFLLGSAPLPAKIKDSLQKALEAGKAVIDQYAEVYKSRFQQLTSDVLAVFDAATAAFQTRTEKIIAAEEAKRRIRDLTDAITDAQHNLNAALGEQAAFTGEGMTPEEAVARRAELAQAVLAAQKALGDAQWELRKSQLEVQAAEERKQYEARREQRRRHLEEELTQLQNYLLRHPEKHKQVQQRILALYRRYGISYKSAGELLGTAFANGLREAEDKIEGAVKRIANIIRRYLELHSPAEKGPLSDLNSWWKPFASTLVSGLDESLIRSHALALARAAGVGVGAYSGAGLLSGALAGANAGHTTVYYVAGSLIHERDLDDRIRSGIIRERQMGRSV